MKTFNVEKTYKEIIDFIRNYYEKNNLKGAVIGISGGKDSAVVSGLFAKALGSENVTGIWMPCHSHQEDYEDALDVADKFGFELKEHDLTKTYDEYVSQIKKQNQVTDNNLVDANINIKPRLRMMTLYYYAAMLSSIKQGVYIVPGTSNKCELYVGYFTKGGDNVSDLQVLADLTVSEVISLGEYIGVPDQVIHKAPNDAISGKTDEEKLGVTYREIELVMNNEETTEVDEKHKEKILSLHQRNSHKFYTETYRKGE